MNQKGKYRIRVLDDVFSLKQKTPMTSYLDLHLDTNSLSVGFAMNVGEELPKAMLLPGKCRFYIHPLTDRQALVRKINQGTWDDLLDVIVKGTKTEDVDARGVSTTMQTQEAYAACNELMEEINKLVLKNV